MAARSNGSKAGSRQRDRLLARPRPSLPYPVRVDDPAEARQRLQKVQQKLRLATLRYDEAEHERARRQLSDAEAAGDDEALAKARRDLQSRDTDASAVTDTQAQVEAVQAEVDACYETVMLTAMHPAEYEQLKAQHPPTEAQLAEGGDPPPDVNVDTFVPAVLAAGCDNGMSAEDWSAFLADHCSDGERQELRTVVLAINERPRFAEPMVLPKGSTTIPSLPWS